MKNLKNELSNVIGNYLSDWDAEESFAGQLDDLASIVVETVNETAPRRHIPDVAVCFYKDGDKWCAVFGDFVDLQESPAGFGDSFDAALSELQASKLKQSRYQPELRHP